MLSRVEIQNVFWTNYVEEYSLNIALKMTKQGGLKAKKLVHFIKSSVWSPKIRLILRRYLSDFEWFVRAPRPNSLRMCYIGM